PRPRRHRLADRAAHLTNPGGQAPLRDQLTSDREPTVEARCSVGAVVEGDFNDVSAEGEPSAGDKDGQVDGGVRQEAVEAELDALDQIVASGVNTHAAAGLDDCRASVAEAEQELLTATPVAAADRSNVELEALGAGDDHFGGDDHQMADANT